MKKGKDLNRLYRELKVRNYLLNHPTNPQPLSSIKAMLRAYSIDHKAYKRIIPN